MSRRRPRSAGQRSPSDGRGAGQGPDPHRLARRLGGRAARALAWLGLAACLAGGLAVTAGLAPFGLTHIVAARWRVPTPVEVRAAIPPSDVQLVDRHGEVVHELRVDHSRRRLAWTPLESIAPELARAVIASEDRRFLRHGGVDVLALGASALGWLGGAPPRGASTITMQLAGILQAAFDGRGAAGRRAGRRGALDKWHQVRAAWAIERSWTKAEILEAYLNLVAFRGEIEGVAAAAHLLFGKAPHALDSAQAIVLAALIRGPGASRAALERRATALARHLGPRLDAGSHRDSPPDAGARLGSRPDTDDQLDSRPDAASQLDSRRGTGVRLDLATAIDRALDPARASAPRIALAGHLAARLLPSSAGVGTVRSTLDAAIQRTTIEALERNLLGLAGRNVRDGAALVVDNASGEILAYVGGSGALSSARHVDGVQAHRQAGSTLKPLLYALALDQRLLTAASSLEDAPLSLPVSGGVYRPRNYDDRFRGLVTVRTALASSLNVPAVRALGLLGADPFAAVLRRLGFSGVDRPGDHYGPALALGAADVSLAELVNAYRTLANGGRWSRLRSTPSVSAAEHGAGVAGTSSAGEVAERGLSGATLGAAPDAVPSAVYSPEAAFVVADVLADRESRSTTFGLESPLATRFWSAVKTGTSKDMRDNWCIGFSARYTVGVWVGNFSGEPMHDVSGVSGAAPAWLEIMSALHRGLGDERPAPPARLVRRRVAFAHGAEPGRDEWFLAGTEPQAERLPLAQRRPRITGPAAESRFAIDPDIPQARQRVAFEADGAPRGARWLLDARHLGPADALALWPTAAGRHRLVLVDATGRVLDEVAFEVRGGASPPAAAAPAITSAGGVSR